MDFMLHASTSVDPPMKSPRALLLPLPHHGHFNPFLQFIRLLVKSEINLTVLCTQERCDELSRRKTNGEFGTLDVEFLGLFRDITREDPPSPFPHFVEDWKALSIDLNPSRYTCIITDLFFHFIQDDADKWGIPRYILCSSPSYVVLYLTQGDKIVEGEWLFANPDKRNQFINLPGLELFTPVQTPRTFALLPPKQTLPPVARNFRRAAGLLLNSFEAFDTEPTELLRQQYQLTPIPGKDPTRVFSIGPLLPYAQDSNGLPQLSSPSSNESAVERSEIIDWLDEQQESSVLFISLGSMRPLSEQVTAAFAEALEQTRIPFLWVLRLRPQCSLDESLPLGFEARTKAQGMVRTDWVPQQQLLQHSSVGGFLSHCGWNSVLEAIWAGIPIAACPMYAEQGMNAKYIVEVAKIAVEIKYKSDLLDFDREAVAAAISTLMDEKKSEKIRQNMRNMRNGAFEAISEGGASQRSFTEFLAEVLRPASF